MASDRNRPQLGRLSHARLTLSESAERSSRRCFTLLENAAAAGLVATIWALMAAPASAGDSCGVPAPCGLDREAVAAPTHSILDSEAAIEDEYLVGDWDGDGCDDIAVRRGNLVLMSTDLLDGSHDLEQRYGRGNNEDEYLVGDWNDDGCDDLAVRRDDQILWDSTFDGVNDGVITFGGGNASDQYLPADLDGDGLEDIGVREGNEWERDLGLGWDGVGDGTTRYGAGNNEDEYFVGHWDPMDMTTRQTYAVRRGNDVLMNYNFDGSHDFTQKYGGGNSEDQYLVGDWDGDGLDNLAVRRGNRILMDTDFSGGHEILFQFGSGTD